jgi:hypothetical protein
MAQSKVGFRVLGLAALAIGVIGGVALWLIAAKRYDDAVASLAPAPAGCDTTLVFDRTGTYTFFVETTGRVGEIDGDCAADEASYDHPDDDPPRVELALFGPDGEEIDLDRADGPSYDRAGAIGRGVRTADIEADGEYVLSVTSDVDDVVVRVGRDPAGGVTPLRIGAVAVLAAGIVLAILAFLRGRAQWTIPAEPGPSAGVWQPEGPPTRPIAPPYANPPTPPPYAPPGSGRPLPPPRPPG